MLSIPDVAILGGLALLLFGPERLPKIARDAGRVMRDLQNTSQAFVRELERAADTAEEEARLEELRKEEARLEELRRAEVAQPEPATVEAVPSDVPERAETPVQSESHAAQPEHRVHEGQTNP